MLFKANGSPGRATRERGKNVCMPLGLGGVRPSAPIDAPASVPGRWPPPHRFLRSFGVSPTTL
jgi:hypothetical protein